MNYIPELHVCGTAVSGKIILRNEVVYPFDKLLEIIFYILSNNRNNLSHECYLNIKALDKVREGTHNKCICAVLLAVPLIGRAAIKMVANKAIVTIGIFTEFL